MKIAAFLFFKLDIHEQSDFYAVLWPNTFFSLTTTPNRTILSDQLDLNVISEVRLLVSNYHLHNIMTFRRLMCVNINDYNLGLAKQTVKTWLLINFKYPIRIQENAQFDYSCASKVLKDDEQVYFSA